MRLFSIQLDQWRFIAFMGALLLYGMFGVLTPDTPGWTESIIGLCLTVACAPGAWALCMGRPVGTGLDGKTYPLWVRCGVVAFLFSLSVPVMVGLLAMNPLRDSLRDGIATCFLFLPLLCYDLFASPVYGRRRLRDFLLMLCGIATVFALRALPYDTESLLRTAISILTPFSSQDLSEPTYLSLSPLLVMTCGVAYAALCRALPPNGFPFLSMLQRVVLIAACCIALAACLTAMNITLQRASLGAVFLLVILTHLVLARTAPRKMLCLTALLGSGVILFWPLLTDVQLILMRLYEKTHTHGLNRRTEEWRAVYDLMTATPLSTLLGTGWGGHFYAPTADGQLISFTHGLISATLLKTGCIGMCVFGVYAFSLAREWARGIFVHPLLSLSLAFPLLINLTLYGAYKSLDFGLLLLLLVSLPLQLPLASEKKSLYNT